MGEPRDRISGRDRLDCRSHGLPERLRGAGAEPSQDGFDLGKRLFDRREVGRIGRQEEQRAVMGFNGLANARALCTLKVSNTTTCPGRSVGANCSVMYQANVTVSMAPSISQGWCTPSGASAATNVRILPVVAWRRSGGALVMLWGAQP